MSGAHIEASKNTPTLWMVGHSNRTFPMFLEVLLTHGIELLVDVRSYPASRRYAQFDRLELERRLPACGIAYRWMPKLGGLPKPVVGSQRNAAWKEDGAAEQQQRLTARHAEHLAPDGGALLGAASRAHLRMPAADLPKMW